MKKLIGVLALCFLMSGCMTMRDGSSGPDVEIIQLSSYAAFTIAIDKIEKHAVSPAQGMAILNTLENYLMHGQFDVPLTMALLEAELFKTVPREYRPLTQLTLVLIKRRVDFFAEPDMLPEEKESQIREIGLAVVRGAQMAVQPYLDQSQM